MTNQNHRFPRSILMALKFFAHGCHCSVDTELIDRKDDAINCINCVHICSEVYRQFSMSFTLENVSVQRSRGTESRMSAFCKFQQHLFCNVVPGSLWAILGRIALLFRTWSNERTIVQYQIFSQELSRFRHLSSIHLCCILSQEMSLNIDIKRILPVKVSGVCPRALSRSLILSTELQRCESWEDVPLEFIWLSIESIIISVAFPGLDSCNSVLQSFVGIVMLKNLSEAQHRI